jgi:hypothetical protein
MEETYGKGAGIGRHSCNQAKNKVLLCQYGGSRKEEMEATPSQG